MPTFVTPTNLIPGSAGNGWNTVDVESATGLSLPDNVSGLIVRCHCRGSYNHMALWPAGSQFEADDERDRVYERAWFEYVGVRNNSGTLEVAIYLSAYTYADLYGYFTDSEAKFFQDPPVLTIGDTGGSYLDVDISTHTGSDTAVAAILKVHGDGAKTRSFGLRKNGSTADLPFEMTSYCGYIVAVDANEIYEAKTIDTDADMYLMGYMTVGWVDSEFEDQTPTATQAWETLRGIPGGHLGAQYLVRGGGDDANDDWGLRINGGSDATDPVWFGPGMDTYKGSDFSEDSYSGLPPQPEHNTIAVAEVDANGAVEGYRYRTETHFYLTGYFADALSWTVDPSDLLHSF